MCLCNYHLGNYRAHAQLAIKYSTLLQRSPERFQTSVPVERGAAASSVGVQGCGVSVSGTGDLRTDAPSGPPQRHRFEAQCCSPRAEISLTGSMSGDGASCLVGGAGSEDTSGRGACPVKVTALWEEAASWAREAETYPRC